MKACRLSYSPLWRCVSDGSCFHYLLFELQETEGDEDGEGEDEVDDEVEEEAENESGAAQRTDEIPSKPDVVVPPVSREPERQLSKKEIKKKELADLEAVLAEFGLEPTEEKDENGAFLCFLSFNREVHSGELSFLFTSFLAFA